MAIGEDLPVKMSIRYFVGEPRCGNLYYVRSSEYGTSFSTPIRVNSQAGSAIATGTIRGGQLAVGRGGRVHVVWNGSDQAKPRGLLNTASGTAEATFLYSRSNASGTAFAPQRALAQRSAGVDGGGSIAADGAGAADRRQGIDSRDSRLERRGADRAA